MTTHSSEQQIQEDQYVFPYHYLTAEKGGDFFQHAYWSWGFRYLGGIYLAQILCGEQEFQSLLDIGCGDGRFLAELAGENKNRRLKGVDYSQRAIGLAKALHPEIDYVSADITTDDFGGEKFDVITLIEVLEHIPPSKLAVFFERCASFLRPGGRMIITVPHKNKNLNEKHFQHFDSGLLKGIVEPHLEIIKYQFFDPRRRLINIWLRMLGGQGHYFLITWKPLTNLFYKFYMKYGLYSKLESNCGRIACVARKKNDVSVTS